MNASSTIRRLSRATLLLALFAFLASTVAASAKKPKPVAQWTATWRTALFALGPASHPEVIAPGLGSKATTLRQTVHVSLGGKLVRIELSNAFGTEPLTVDAVHLALAGEAPGTIQLPTANALTFNGVPHLTIAPGATALSDPAALTLVPGNDLVVSMLMPAQPISAITGHSDAFQTNYLVPGDRVGAQSFALKADPTAAQPTNSWFFLQGVEVKTPDEPASPRAAIVAFGDSITDGYGSTPNMNARWPDVLARRLAANRATERIAVLNAGIGGNRVLHDGRGPKALARFDRDVLDVAGVRAVVILESINDIGRGSNANDPSEQVSADELIAGLTDLAKRAHARGLRVIGGTLTPYAGAGYFSTGGETIRQAVNAWVRISPVFDGVIDFEKAVRDPAQGDRFLPAFDCGDHLHPNDAGYRAMGEAIDLGLFADGEK